MQTIHTIRCWENVAVTYWRHDERHAWQSRPTHSERTPNQQVLGRQHDQWRSRPFDVICPPAQYYKSHITTEQSTIHHPQHRPLSVYLQQTNEYYWMNGWRGGATECIYNRLTSITEWKVQTAHSGISLTVLVWENVACRVCIWWHTAVTTV